jgi:hypothetical protein
VRYRFYKHYGSDGVPFTTFEPRPLRMVDVGSMAHRGSIIGVTIDLLVIIFVALQPSETHIWNEGKHRIFRRSC